MQLNTVLPDKQWHCAAALNQTLFSFLFQAYSRCHVHMLLPHQGWSLSFHIWPALYQLVPNYDRSSIWVAHCLFFLFLFFFLTAIARKAPFDFKKDWVEDLFVRSEEVICSSHNSASPCIFVFFFYLLIASVPEVVLLKKPNFH